MGESIKREQIATGNRQSGSRRYARMLRLNHVCFLDELPRQALKDRVCAPGDSEMEYKNTTFANCDVELDDNQFIGCAFDGCILIYRGGPPPSLINCTFANQRFIFLDSAANTMSFITGMYHSGLRSVIKKTFDDIAHNPKRKDWTLN